MKLWQPFAPLTAVGCSTQLEFQLGLGYKAIVQCLVKMSKKNFGTKLQCITPNSAGPIEVT